MKSKRASVLWTGGKDSALALYDAQLLGYNVVNLVTFAPEGEMFRAHPLDIMSHQAKTLSMSHSIISMKEPFKKSYEEAIFDLKRKQGIDILVTGDISEVDGHPNWIRECSKSSHMEVCTPLWHSDSTALMERLLFSGFKVIFSCVKRPWFTEDWVGRALDISAFHLLHKMAADTGIDICGENGEYHTMVLDSPSFKKQLSIRSFSIRQEDSLMYLSAHNTSICDKE